MRRPRRLAGREASAFVWLGAGRVGFNTSMATSSRTNVGEAIWWPIVSDRRPEHSRHDLNEARHMPRLLEECGHGRLETFHDDVLVMTARQDHGHVRTPGADDAQ